MNKFVSNLKDKDAFDIQYFTLCQQISRKEQNLQWIDSANQFCLYIPEFIVYCIWHGHSNSVGTAIYIYAQAPNALYLKLVKKR